MTRVYCTFCENCEKFVIVKSNGYENISMLIQENSKLAKLNSDELRYVINYYKMAGICPVCENKMTNFVIEDNEFLEKYEKIKDRIDKINLIKLYIIKK